MEFQCHGMESRNGPFWDDFLRVFSFCLLLCHLPVAIIVFAVICIPISPSLLFRISPNMYILFLLTLNAIVTTTSCVLSMIHDMTVFPLRCLFFSTLAYMLRTSSFEFPMQCHWQAIGENNLNQDSIIYTYKNQCCVVGLRS